MMKQPLLNVLAITVLTSGMLIGPGAVADDSIGIVQMEVFVRGDKASAAQVEQYVSELSRRVPGLEVKIHDVIADRDQLKRLYELSRKAGRSKPVVPAFHCCDRMYFGFDSVTQSGPAIEDLFTAEVYTRSTCPRCINAKKFIKVLNQRWPAIRFRIHEISLDAAARQRWENLCRGAGSAPGLPTIDFGGYVIIGYQGDQITGKQLEQIIERKARINAIPARSPPTVDAGASWFAGPAFSVLGMLQADLNELSVEEDDLDQWALPDEAGEGDVGEAVIATETPADSELIDEIDVPVFGRLRVSDLGMPLFSFLVGLVDGFNPCAMWILVFLLSVLVNIKDRTKIVMIAGTFVLVSGLAYYAFMAAWLNLFLLIGIARPVQIALGLLALFIGIVNVKDFFAFKKGISFSIPEDQKPGLYRRVREIVNAKYLSVAIAGAMTLAVIVNMVELLCTAGLPALFTQVLTLQELPPWQNYLLLGVYIFAYMLDDAALVAVVVATLSHRKLQEREGRWLKLLSGVVILVLGTVMIVRPEWLQLYT